MMRTLVLLLAAVGIASAQPYVFPPASGGGGGGGYSNLTQNGDGTLTAASAFADAPCSTPTYNAGGTTTINLATANCAVITISGGNTTLAVSNPHASVHFRIIYIADTVARTITYPASFHGGAQPAFESGGEITVQSFTLRSTTYEGDQPSCPTCIGSSWNGPTRAAEGTPAAGNLNCWFDSTDLTPECKDESANINKMVRAGSLMTMTGASLNANTAKVADTTALQQGDWMTVNSTSGNTTYAGCPTNGLANSGTATALTDRMVVWVKVDTASTTTATYNHCGTGAKNVKQSDGTTDPGTRIPAGIVFPLTYDLANTIWRLPPQFNTKARAISFAIGDPAGSALTVASTTTDYVTVPFACTISAYNLLVDAGTITVKFWRKATGTAIPTSTDSISTSGVSISSGTAIHSTTVSDFTSTAIAANDILAVNVTAVSTAKFVNAVLQCDQN